MKTIYILDDHKLFSSGLKLLLKSLPMQIDCIGFDNAELFLKAVTKEENAPALFIIDFYIPGCNVPDLISGLLKENNQRRILVISASINISDRNLALCAGAAMFLNKNVDLDVLLKTVTSLLSGKNLNTDAPPQDDHAKKFGLTPRQLETLVLVSKGLSNKEVARTLSISPETVKTHLKDIFMRFGVSNKIEAMDFARSNGLS